jgi:hypothetical protein
MAGSGSSQISLCCVGKEIHAGGSIDEDCVSANLPSLIFLQVMAETVKATDYKGFRGEKVCVQGNLDGALKPAVVVDFRGLFRAREAAPGRFKRDWQPGPVAGRR